MCESLLVTNEGGSKDESSLREEGEDERACSEDKVKEEPESSVKEKSGDELGVSDLFNVFGKRVYKQRATLARSCSTVCTIPI